MKYLCYIFDLDGTIMDSRDSILNALRDTMSDFKLNTDDMFKGTAYIGHTLEHVLSSVGLIDTEKARVFYRKHYYDYIADEKPYSGIPEMLKALHNRVLVSLCTNKGHNGARVTLENHGLLSYFDTIESVDSGKAKPDPDTFHHIIDFYGKQGKKLQPEDCLMIGDSPTDMEFAYNCGMDSAFVKWGFFKKSDLKHEPSYIISDARQLIDIAEEPYHMEITEEIDLHHFHPRETRNVVVDYLTEARKKKFTTVRIIHGKGIGVQRNIVQKVLERDSNIKNFYDAPAYAGGRGATIVELK